MRLGHLDFIFLLFLLPLLVGCSFWYFIKQRKTWRKLGNPSLKNILMPTTSPTREYFKHALKILTMIFIILALVEPMWGTREEEIKLKGIDLMLLVDVSNSMLAEDIQPTRIEREKRELRDLVDMLAGDRVGLVAFAGGSFLLSPLTNDYGTLEIFFDEVSTDTIPVGGTDLSGALNLAVQAMSQDRNSEKAILIFTDGEDHSQHLKEMIKTLKEKSIKVFVLGIGTPEGAPVPESSGGFKNDENGRMIISKLAEGNLKDLALTTGGAYARSVTGDEDLRQLYLKGIRGVLDPTELKTSKRTIWETRFYWPLGFACLFLLLERGIARASRD